MSGCWLAERDLCVGASEGKHAVAAVARILCCRLSASKQADDAL
jgi:hypothetical protein